MLCIEHTQADQRRCIGTALVSWDISRGKLHSSSCNVSFHVMSTSASFYSAAAIFIYNGEQTMDLQLGLSAAVRERQR